MATINRYGMTFPTGRRHAFTLIELMAVIGIIAILTAIAAGAVREGIRKASLATSANNIRQLAAGSAGYLMENRQTFWPYRENVREADRRGIAWWFGFESEESLGKPEGERSFDPGQGPLAGYVPAGFEPDPSFGFAGKPLKPKYRFGYIGIGYNVLLGGGWMGVQPKVRLNELETPSRVVVFATSAQINTFQPPASSKRPMIEEFYGIDERETTVHFRHSGEAMVTFADSSVGFLSMDETTRDNRDPDANVGRFAPIGSEKYLR